MVWVTTVPLSSDHREKKRGGGEQRQRRVLRSASLRTNELCGSAALAGGASSRAAPRRAWPRAPGPGPLKGAVRGPAPLGEDERNSAAPYL